MASRVIGDYVLKDKLGFGQYGNVFLADDVQKKGQYAVKIIPIQKFKITPRLSEFTANEIDILSKVDSPHIVKFKEMLRTVNNYYLIYEYCNGGTLADLLEKRRFLPETEALKIFSQILEAFKILVRENILHRDLKPTNILFHNGVLKIADFGFCKEMKENSMAKTMVGSPIYMAPEVLKNQNYNSKADIWSMGVVLYQMLFGLCPYEEKSIADLITLMDLHPLTFPTAINPISESTQTLLRKMLTVDARKRIGAQQLLAYKLNLPRKIQEEIFKYHRDTLQYMLETLLEAVNIVDQSKQKLVLAYLLYKTIFCYENDLRKKERYWHLVKVTTFPDAWEGIIQDQNSKIQPVGAALKAAIQHTNPSTKLKIELDTFYVNISLFFEYIETLKNNDPIKFKLANCILMYRHMFNALQKQQIFFDRVITPNEQYDYLQLIDKRLEKCRDFIKDIMKTNYA